MLDIQKVLDDKEAEPMWLYCDIDGTLTDSAGVPWGNARFEVIAKLKDCIEAGYRVVLWSACGEQYCRDFAQQYHIKPFVCLSKPDIVLDDNLKIRDAQHMFVVLPEDFMSMVIEK
jgi:hydroxymethylpyrimidine pyrophosphatase-like HAD family hydrolase